MIGYFFAILIGFSLGLLGGGGSILTVPVLVYALGMDPKQSIALSLAIVAATSLFGVFGHFKNKNIDFKIAAIFGPVAMAGTFLGAKLSVFLTGTMQLILFAIIMIIAAVFMIKPKKQVAAEEAHNEVEEKKLNYALIVAEGIFVGDVEDAGGFFFLFVADVHDAGGGGVFNRVSSNF